VRWHGMRSIAGKRGVLQNCVNWIWGVSNFAVNGVFVMIVLSHVCFYTVHVSGYTRTVKLLTAYM